jgi:hypothetical protein
VPPQIEAETESMRTVPAISSPPFVPRVQPRLTAALRRVWDDPAMAGGAHAAIEEVRCRHFDLETICSTLFGMLDGMVPLLPTV